MSAYTADRVVPEFHSFHSKTRTDLLNKGNKWQAEQDQGAIVGEIEAAIARGDTAALDANTRLTLGHIRPRCRKPSARLNIVKAASGDGRSTN